MAKKRTAAKAVLKNRLAVHSPSIRKATPKWVSLPRPTGRDDTGQSAVLADTFLAAAGKRFSAGQMTLPHDEESPGAEVYALARQAITPTTMVAAKTMASGAEIAASLPEEETNETLRMPARATGLVGSFPEDGSTPNFGTAWLINPRILVTAAHNVWLGQSRSRVRVSLAHNGDLQEAKWLDCSASVPDTWKDRPSTGNPADFALLELEQAMTNPNVAYFGLAAAPDEALDRIQINSLGYPGVRNWDFRMLWTGGAILRTDLKSLAYSTYNGPGMSGGPIYVKYGDHRTAVGIHRGVKNWNNVEICVATRIDKVVYDLIGNFIARTSPNS